MSNKIYIILLIAIVCLGIFVVQHDTGLVQSESSSMIDGNFEEVKFNIGVYSDDSAGDFIESYSPNQDLDGLLMSDSISHLDITNAGHISRSAYFNFPQTTEYKRIDNAKIIILGGTEPITSAASPNKTGEKVYSDVIKYNWGDNLDESDWFMGYGSRSALHSDGPVIETLTYGELVENVRKEIDVSDEVSSEENFKMVMKLNDERIYDGYKPLYLNEIFLDIDGEKYENHTLTVENNVNGDVIVE